MELILSAISAGGLVGAANQYACLLIVGIAAKFGWITLSPATDFMGSTWFIVLIGLFWVLTVAPAYATHFAPGVMNAIHSATNFLSGFIVPLSSALLSLAAAGIISNLDPEMKLMLQTMKVFTESGGIGTAGYVMAGVSGATAVTLTGMRAVAKPGFSVSTGTTGGAAAPIFATTENVASIVLMVVAYLLTKIDPWLLVVLMVVVILAILAFLFYGIYQFWKVRRGIGKVLYLAQVYPKAGLAVVTEFFVWGSGWFAWNTYGRGVLMLFFLAMWIICAFVVQPMIVVIFPPLGVATIVLLAMVYIAIGMGSARALLKKVEKEIPRDVMTKKSNAPA